MCSGVGSPRARPTLKCRPLLLNRTFPTSINRLQVCSSPLLAVGTNTLFIDSLHRGQMRFSTATTIFSGMALLIATTKAVTCDTFAFGNIDKGALTSCLNSYRNGNWDGMECGGRGWFKGGSAYNSPNDCYDACQDCIQREINAGASNVECDDYETFAKCWMGYH